MPHPFFENTAYPWRRREATALYRVLLQALPDPTEIFRLYQRAGGDPGALVRPQPPNALWHEALERLAAAYRLEALCTDVRDAFPHNTEVQQAIRDVVEALPATQQQLVSDHDVLVLDRAGLRRRLEALEHDRSPLKVLVVRGGRKSGKSRARFLFSELAKDRGARSVYVAMGLVGTVDELMWRLLAEVGDEDEDLGKGATTGPAWYRAFCLRLYKLAERHDRCVWVAVDDLGFDADGAPLLDPEIRDFCNVFGVMLLDEAFARRFRLLLIHYPPGPVPAYWRSELWAEDVTSEDDITQEHVAEFLRRWAAHRGVTLREPDVEREAAAILACADTDDGTGTPRLKRLHDAVMARLEQLSAAVPAAGG